jgi:hypothetical protein
MTRGRDLRGPAKDPATGMHGACVDLAQTRSSSFRSGLAYWELNIAANGPVVGPKALRDGRCGGNEPCWCSTSSPPFPSRPHAQALQPGPKRQDRQECARRDEQSASRRSHLGVPAHQPGRARCGSKDPQAKRFPPRVDCRRARTVARRRTRGQVCRYVGPCCDHWNAKVGARGRPPRDARPGDWLSASGGHESRRGRPRPGI